jgi:hypothetical protein
LYTRRRYFYQFNNYCSCTFINNIATSPGFGKDIAINSSSNIPYLSPSYLNNVCSTSDSPRISGNSTALTANIKNCNEGNDDYLIFCKIIHSCSDFYEDRNECNLRTNINTKDGPCLFLLSGKEGDTGSCIAKNSITECGNYSNVNQCEDDDLIGGTGCKWDDDDDECVVSNSNNSNNSNNDELNLNLEIVCYLLLFIFFL